MSGTDDWYRDLHDQKCKAKRRFHTAQQAKAAALEEGVRRSKDLFYYRCPNCSKFHLTSTDPREYDFLQFKAAMDQALGAGLITRREYGKAIRKFQQERR